MSDDLITSLRALAAARHDDLSIAVDAVIEIERQRAEVERHRAEIERLREVIRTIRARCVELDDSDAVSETLDIATAVLEAKP